MSDIKLLNWNVCGLNCAARREAVKIMIQEAGPQIICLQETKLDNVTSFLAMEFLGHPCMCFKYLPAESTRGGILVAWNKDFVEAESPIRQLYTLSLNLTMKLSNVAFKITTVYGPTEDSLKPSFLAELVDCQPPFGMPWLCLGDFNLIYEARDKNNSNINRRMMGRFRRALDDSELLELRLQNKRYTWSNGRASPTLVHLDRVFCNKEWDAAFPATSLQALSSSLSDHSPLFLGSHQHAPRSASFRFEYFWPRAPGFLDVVVSAWNGPARGMSPLMIFHNRLMATG